MIRFLSFLKECIASSSASTHIFSQLISERDASAALEAANRINTLKSKIYEHETVLAIHDKSGAAGNTNPEYQAKIKKLRDEHEANKLALPDKVKEYTISAAHKSADSYLQSLQKQGISKEDISEVHHTGSGISKHVGEKVDRSQNPHDLIVKTKKGQIHGASLKETSGTLSNNGVGKFAAHGHDTTIGHSTSNIWDEGISKAGLKGLTDSQIKEKQKDPKVVQAYRETQHAAASHHTESFNAATHDDKRKHLEMLMKLGYHKKAPYDYVNAEKGTSTPIEDLQHAKLLRSAKKLTATQSGNLVHIHDEKGNKILTVEHRSTHGPFRHNQVNAKLPSIKK
jgi:hypothetical protein